MSPRHHKESVKIQDTAGTLRNLQVQLELAEAEAKTGKPKTGTYEKVYSTSDTQETSQDDSMIADDATMMSAPQFGNLEKQEQEDFLAASIADGSLDQNAVQMDPSEYARLQKRTAGAPESASMTEDYDSEEIAALKREVQGLASMEHGTITPTEVAHGAEDPEVEPGRVGGFRYDKAGSDPAQEKNDEDFLQHVMADQKKAGLAVEKTERQKFTLGNTTYFAGDVADPILVQTINHSVPRNKKWLRSKHWVVKEFLRSKDSDEVWAVFENKKEKTLKLNTAWLTDKFNKMFIDNIVGNQFKEEHGEDYVRDAKAENEKREKGEALQKELTGLYRHFHSAQKRGLENDPAFNELKERLGKVKAAVEADDAMMLIDDEELVYPGRTMADKKTNEIWRFIAVDSKNNMASVLANDGRLFEFTKEMLHIGGLNREKLLELLVQQKQKEVEKTKEAQAAPEEKVETIELPDDLDALSLPELQNLKARLKEVAAKKEALKRKIETGTSPQQVLIKKYAEKQKEFENKYGKEYSWVNYTTAEELAAERAYILNSLNSLSNHWSKLDNQGKRNVLSHIKPLKPGFLSGMDARKIDFDKLFTQLKEFHDVG